MRRGKEKNGHALTAEEVRDLAETKARQMLGVSFQAALAMLDRGDLRGTIAEAELKMLRYLMGAGEPATA